MRLPDMLQVLVRTLWQHNIAVEWRLDMVSFPDGTVASKLDNGDFRPSETKDHAAVINQQIDDLHGDLINMLDRASYETHSFRLTLKFKCEVLPAHARKPGAKVPDFIGKFVMDMRHHVDEQQKDTGFRQLIVDLSLNSDHAKHFAKSEIAIHKDWHGYITGLISLEGLHQSIHTVGAIMARRCGYECESARAGRLQPG